jgi:hypothetical protein
MTSAQQSADAARLGRSARSPGPAAASDPGDAERVSSAVATGLDASICVPMSRCARLLRVLPLVLLVALAVPTAASANAFQQVLQNFLKNHGYINPCTLSEATLNAALGEIPNDYQQYASDIQRAIHAPTPPPTQGPTAPTVKAAKPVFRVQAPPTPPAVTKQTQDTGTVYPAETVAAHTSSGPPAALVILGALAAALGLVGLLAALSRALGLEPRWSLGVRHAFGEAGYRTAGVWAEFTDWVRLGR